MPSGSNDKGILPASVSLVTLEPGCAAHGIVAPKPLAGFVTQLLACCDQLPAYRARRRAEPRTALASYGAGGAVPHGCRYERVL